MGKTRAPKVSRVIAYIRVSTGKQVDEGVSLDAQRAKLTAYAVALDLVLVDVIVDAGESAKTLERPGLQRALAMLSAGEADGLLVTKLDRLTRSVRDLGDLIETHFGESAGFALLSVADSIDTRTASGRLVLNVLMSVSQWERETISERTRDALQYMKSQGVKLGGPTLTGPAVERARALRSEGHTLRAIATALTAEGFATMRGGKWASETVRLIVSRTDACIVNASTSNIETLSPRADASPDEFANSSGSHQH